MAVVIETTIGDFTIHLLYEERPKACLNFLKLCKLKYYNLNLFHTIQRNFIAQTGDQTGSGKGGQSIFSFLSQDNARFFRPETEPKIGHRKLGTVSFVADSDGMISSQFFITLSSDLIYLDEQKHCVFATVAEGFETLQLLNETICDRSGRPYRDVRITHTVILHDPLPDPPRLQVPEISPPATPSRLQNGQLPADEDIDDGGGDVNGADYDDEASRAAREEVLKEKIREREAKNSARILELVGDIPDEDVAPPENVLFVCKLNPVTSDEDLEIIFSRFGDVKSCEVIRDKDSGDSLQYAFVEFGDKESCERAYFKMNNVVIDDRRIHVDFSQSVSRMKWAPPSSKTASSKRSPKKSRSRSQSPVRYKSRKRHADRSRSKSRNRDRDRDREKSRNRDRDRHRDHRRSPRNDHRSHKKDRNRSRSRSRGHGHGRHRK